MSNKQEIIELIKEASSLIKEAASTVEVAESTPTINLAELRSLVNG